MPIQVGLLGIGTVGGGTFAVLQRNQEEIRRRAGREIRITMVADLDVERAKKIVGDAAQVVSDARAVIANPDRHRRRADRWLRHRQDAGAGGHRRRQACGHRQQGAARRAWQRDLRRGAPPRAWSSPSRRRWPAASPSSRRCARPDRQPHRVGRRHHQRHHQLHPLGDARQGAGLRRGAGKRSAWVMPRPTRPSTSRASTPRTRRPS